MISSIRRLVNLAALVCNVNQWLSARVLALPSMVAGSISSKILCFKRISSLYFEKSLKDIFDYIFYVQGCLFLFFKLLPFWRKSGQVTHVDEVEREVKEM